MKIENSELLNDFLSFWFETRVDGILRFETLLDYHNMQWQTRELEESNKIIASGKIARSSNQDEEKSEEDRIRACVTQAILKPNQSGYMT